MHPAAFNPLHLLRAARPLLLAVAILLGLGQGAGALHFALIEHTRCAEHGELIHVAGGHAADTHAGTAHAAESPQAGWHAGTADDDDDHCDVTALLRSRPMSLAPPATSAAPIAVAHRVVACGKARTAWPAAPLLLSAPKTSPPSFV